MRWEILNHPSIMFNQIITIFYIVDQKLDYSNNVFLFFYILERQS